MIVHDTAAASLAGMQPAAHFSVARNNALPSNPLDPILAVVDPLVPPPSLWKDSESSAELQPYDRASMSAYARIVHALLSVAADDRRLARTNTWLLRHFLTLAQAATERLMLPAAYSAYFARGVAEEALQDIIARVQTLTLFLLADVGDDGWHHAITQAFLKGTGQSQLPGVAGFVATLLAVTVRTDTVRESKVLYTVMQHILNGATPADAEHWVALTRRLEKQSPNFALAIVLAIAESALKPLGLARYRNEAATGVLGVPAAKANIDGLRLHRRLACAAPDPDSDVEFLPSTRAVNFMRACQAWVHTVLLLDRLCSRRWRGGDVPRPTLAVRQGMCRERGHECGLHGVQVRVHSSGVKQCALDECEQEVTRTVRPGGRRLPQPCTSCLGQPRPAWCFSGQILDAAARADFLASFWAALDGRAFSSLERATSSAAFLSALLECLVLLSKRARASTNGLDETEAPETRRRGAVV
ncbi:hypothetical protein DFH11DRAFT_1772348 [Phellopilus nigrolimitatus]|nr:hypothetical protein DFH11DRAFT_1772348 [Phellopilus nigrolimitatus]